MRMLGSRVLAIIATVGLTLAAHAAVAATTAVNVQLADKVTDGPMATGIMYGTSNIDRTKATSLMEPSKTSAPTGAVTFNVTNSSKDMVHEMIVVAIPASAVGQPVPYDAVQHEVDETKIKSMGEVSELDPGKSGKLTVTLQPGTYLLICNQPGHYEAGMWAVFTVTK